MRSDPRAHYALLKDLYRQAYAAKPVRVDPSGIDLTDCEDTPAESITEALTNYDDAVLPLAQLAHEIVRVRAVLAAAGYPERVWAPLVDQFEQRQLPLVIAEVRNYRPQQQGGFEETPAAKNTQLFQDRLAATLESYRRSSGANLPPLSNEGGCGAGEVGVLVKTVPANGSVLFIPKFFYQLCQKQRVDPADPRRCDWWREAPEGMLMGFAGDYLYRAIWPDGATRDGRISFNDPKDGQTFVIRHP